MDNLTVGVCMYKWKNEGICDEHWNIVLEIGSARLQVELWHPAK